MAGQQDETASEWGGRGLGMATMGSEGKRTYGDFNRMMAKGGSMENLSMGPQVHPLPPHSAALRHTPLSSVSRPPSPPSVSALRLRPPPPPLHSCTNLLAAR